MLSVRYVQTGRRSTHLEIGSTVETSVRRDMYSAEGGVKANDGRGETLITVLDMVWRMTPFMSNGIDNVYSKSE